MRITAKRLLELGFQRKGEGEKVLYVLNEYALKAEGGRWQTVGIHNGVPLSGLLVLETREQLNHNYFELTVKKLKKRAL